MVIEEQPQQHPAAGTPAPIERDSFWLGLLGCIVLALALAAGPIALAKIVNPWLGVGASVLTILVWVRYGPRPTPGFFQGLVAVNGLLLLIVVLIACVLMAFGIAG